MDDLREEGGGMPMNQLYERALAPAQTRPTPLSWARFSRQRRVALRAKLCSRRLVEGHAVIEAMREMLVEPRY